MAKIDYYVDNVRLGKYNILYLNINSLRENLEELEFILKEHQRIYLIVLTGIKIPIQQNAVFNIHNYQGYFNNRGDGKAGVALYVHNNMISTEVVNNYTEHVHQLVVNIHSLSINFGVIYTESEYHKEKAMQMYNNLIKTYRRMILFADIDIDLLDWHNEYTEDYINDTLGERKFFLNKLAYTAATKMIQSQTDPDEKMPILVDHIVSDLKKFDFTVSLSDVIFSEHKQIVVSFDDHSSKKINFETAPKRYAQREINTSRYSSLLAQTLFDTDSFTNFIEILFNIRNNSWQLVFKDSPLYSAHPWYNQEVSDLIHKRNAYFKLWKENPRSQELRTMYDELVQRVEKIVTHLRSRYNGQRINECEDNPKQMRKIISQIIENTNNDHDKIKAIRGDNDKILTRPKQIANHFNDYFREIGRELFNLIPEMAYEFFDTLDRNPYNMMIRPVQQDEVIQKIGQMKLTTHRNEIISSKLMKENSELLAPTLSHLINICLYDGQFPDELKVARIIPKFKKSDNDKLKASNYRPIHVLQSLSKLIEMIIYDRVKDHCMKYNVFHRHQFGFLKKAGTAGAAATLIDYVQANVDNSSFGACVFMDLKKASDTVPHSHLIEKLDKIGIRGSMLDLIEDYLRNRKQFVDINGTCSATIDCNQIGIPQGSNIGSLLLILYINDMFSLPLIGKIILFCDDITLIYVTKNAKRLQEQINTDLHLLNNWLEYNKLTINMEKIRYMVLSKNNKFFNVDLNLTVKGEQIERVRTQKYLGLLIQHNFKWNQQISKVARNIDGIGGTIKRLGNEISLKVRKQIYYNMIYQPLTTLLSIFGTSVHGTDTEVNTLQRAQDKTIRRLFGRDSDVQLVTDTLYKNNRIMTVKQLIELDSVLLHRKMVFDNRKFGNNCHENNEDLIEARYNPITIQNKCMRIYKDLDEDIKNIEDYDAFKNAIKRIILSGEELEEF